jgi:hypothetical protein
MRVVARNMAFLIKSIKLGKEAFSLPKVKERVRTNLHLLFTLR